MTVWMMRLEKKEFHISNEICAFQRHSCRYAMLIDLGASGHKTRAYFVLLFIVSATLDGYIYQQTTIVISFFVHLPLAWFLFDESGRIGIFLSGPVQDSRPH
ncbi:hypothetical protein BDV59DRAFT_37097 [Aspergillus ambiguus]|uniref:uncharacterized protein n=1 Tax=Aspergillus ambiguus TaxID=176160 RepID=UPI003CCD5B11